MLKALAAMVVTLLALGVMAQSAQIQVEINGDKNKIELKPGIVPAGVKLSNDSQYALVCSGGKVTKDWTDYEFTFTPSQSGIVQFCLRGPNAGTDDNPVWVGYDNVKVSGAALKNPDFEELSENGEFNGWSGNITNMIKEVPDAQTGKNYIRVKYNLPVKQDLTVTQDQPVTVKFSIKAVDSPIGI
jgi:hypothetical protein